MKRAVYCKNENGTYSISHLKSIRNNGTIEIEPIDIFENVEFESLIDLYSKANLSGYGVVGDYETIENNNKIRYSHEKLNDNLMNIDDL